MSFPMASRFSHYVPCSPSPTAYNIPHAFDESGSNKSGAWTKPFLFTGHKCDENCTSNMLCKRECTEKRSGLFKKPLINKRYSLDPNMIKFSGAPQGTIEGTHQNKASEHSKANLSAGSSENKENIFSPQRKISSHIPRFKKNVTEGQAPSFVINPRDIHSCYNIDKKENSPSISGFNRYSIGRKSVKPIKKHDRSTDSMADDSLEKDETLYSAGSVLKKKRPFNKSYTVLPKVDENPPTHTFKNTPAAKTDPKYVDESLNVDNAAFSLSKLLKKDSELAKELSETSRTSKYYEITSKQDDHISDLNNVDDDDDDKAEKIRSCDISGLDDCSVIFLVSEEFIDDEYDSYMKGLNGAKSYLQVSQNKELYDMAKCLVSVYLQGYGHLESHKRSKSVMKMKANLEKTVRMKIGKFFTKGKRKISVANHEVKNKTLWNDIESIIRQAIKELKGEFQMEICKKTNLKLDQLISDVKSTVLKANEDIEVKCERTTENLISRLQNMAMK